jgi:hypothetical protein
MLTPEAQCHRVVVAVELQAPKLPAVLVADMVVLMSKLVAVDPIRHLVAWNSAAAMTHLSTQALGALTEKNLQAACFVAWFVVVEEPYQPQDVEEPYQPQDAADSERWI